MSDAIRLQRMVPAEARRDEAVPAIVERPIPADERDGSPAPVESPQQLEALVAELETALSSVVWVKANSRHFNSLQVWVTTRTAESAIRAALIEIRRCSATGGNDEICERRGKECGS